MYFTFTCYKPIHCFYFNLNSKMFHKEAIKGEKYALD